MDVKIAILIPKFMENSADARGVLHQINDFDLIHDEVDIFTLKTDLNPDNVGIYVMGMPQHSLLERIYRIILPLDLIKTLKWVPKLKQYDMIICHLYPMDWFAFLAKKLYNVQYVYWYHGIPPAKLFIRFYEKLYILCTIFLMRHMVQNVDKAVSVSHYASQEFKKYTGVDSEVVYNKTDLNLFKMGLDGTKIREYYGIGSDPVILTVARVSPHKGIHLIVEVHNIIKTTIPNVKLFIVGGHPYQYYSKMVKAMASDSIIFTEYIPNTELPYYYAMCDIYATCTLWETFNRPILEAQSCGKPVVAFNIGPHHEVIGDDGILVEEGNIQKFAEACINKIYEVRGDLVESTSKVL